MTEPFLTVVIPTFERDDQLAECLKLLASGRQLLTSDCYEVLVTDDGVASTCESLVEKQFPWVRRTEGPHRGPAANRNHGVKNARARWIVFCDDDCLPSSEFLQAYWDAIREHPKVQVFEGRTVADRPKRHPLEGAPINEQGGMFWSCNLAVEAQYFRELGGFNEAFPYAAMEDIDFRKRIFGSGAPTLFVRDAVVVHPWRMLDVKRHTERHVASQLIYATLHPDESDISSFRRHLKNIVRYYVRDFPSELRDYGLLALRCQPMKWWEIAYRGWYSLVKSRAR